MKLKLSFFKARKSDDDLKLIRFIIQKFGYRPNNIDLFKKALTHKSLLSTQEVDTNERLEFLGDSILDAVVAEFLYLRFPEEDEGYLTKVKSKVVSRKTLGDIGEEMELREVIKYHKKRAINLSTLEGNAFEALIGAIYLDGGYGAVQKSVFNHVFRKYINLNKLLEEEIDFKSRLYIWSQKNRLVLDFQILEEDLVDSVWIYKVQVCINGQNYGTGSGNTKKQAEQNASKETLELIGEI